MPSVGCLRRSLERIKRTGLIAVFHRNGTKNANLQQLMCDRWSLNSIYGQLVVSAESELSQGVLATLLLDAPDLNDR